MKAFDLNDAVQRHQRGECLHSIAKSYEVKRDTLKKAFERVGIAIRVVSPKELRCQVPVERILKMYKGGMSAKTIAEKMNVSRSVIHRRLSDCGVKYRNRHFAMLNRMHHTSKKERQRITANAHAAVKGKKYTFTERCRRAQSRQMSFRNHNGRQPTSVLERKFWRMAAEHGLSLTPQYAIGPYNVDFRTEGAPIAVEIFGGGWHSHGKHQRIFAERSEYIAHRGYTLVIIWVDGISSIQEGSVHKLQSLVQQFRRDKSALRQQYVILGNGESTTRGEKDLHYQTGVNRLRH